ncbi:hypothetical protein PS627_00485 [Pseudomonas fluorescens]|nr:hypothetical protein PS627_00485 [Pseudomonas fluorescens]
MGSSHRILDHITTFKPWPLVKRVLAFLAIQ